MQGISFTRLRRCIAAIAFVIMAGIALSVALDSRWPAQIVLAATLTPLAIAHALSYTWERCANERDRNRTVALDALERLIDAVDKLAEQSRSTESQERKDWLLQNGRKNLARSFIFLAADLGVTQPEMVRLLNRTLFHLDPLALRDVVNAIAKREGWPSGSLAWRSDLMTFVRCPTRYSAAEAERFEETLRAYDC